VVVLREDNPGDKRLVAYVTGDNPDPANLKQSLKDNLPEYMVPGIIVVVDEVPLTPSGKVARRRLPAPEYSRDDSTPYEAPRNPTEVKLAAIWVEVLGINNDKQPVGIHDDFFHLGGHSLLATQVISRIRDHFEINLPLKFIFRHPTPAALAPTITALLTTVSGAGESADDDDDENYEELSF
jgi:acyl carrier protein